MIKKLNSNQSNKLKYEEATTKKVLLSESYNDEEDMTKMPCRSILNPRPGPFVLTKTRLPKYQQFLS